jgi:hypothetical protein
MMQPAATRPVHTRIGAIGSCVTVDALRQLGLGKDQLARFYARTSLASSSRPSPGCSGLPSSLLAGVELPGTVRRWLEAELGKSILDALATARPSALIFDWIDERFDLLVLDSGLAFNESWDFIERGLGKLPVFAAARRVARLSDEAWTLWNAGLVRLKQWKDVALPDCTVVLHRASWASRVRSATGVEHLPDATLIMPGVSASRARHNDLLDRYSARFLQVFPEARVVEAGPELRDADAHHVWGVSPFHYVPAYYQAIAEQLQALGIAPSASVARAATMSDREAEVVRAATQFGVAPTLDDQENIHAEWRRYLDAIAEHIINDRLDRFTQWRTVTQTMFIGDYADTARQLKALRARPDFSSRWAPALVESPVGGAGRSELYPASSGNQIRQAYLLARFEDEMGARIDSFDQVVELGGGFGALCRLVHRLGFRGRYVLIDPQPVRALQRWYLAENGLDLAPDGELSSRSGIQLASSALLEEAVCAPRVGRSAFIANWSLSETHPNFRDNVLRALRKAHVDAIFVTYQKTFGVDNSRYFIGKIQDFADVYEASVRPMQPDASSEDYCYGHACLALRRVAGRSFPAADLELEPAPFETDQMLHLTGDELHAKIRDAISNHTPLSVIRLGDGEARIIGFPKHVSRPLVADIWLTWFGRSDFKDAHVERVREALKEACLHADVVGVPRARADLQSEFGRVKALLPREGFVHPSTPLCHAGFHLRFHRENRYRALFEGLGRIGVIGPRDLTARIPALIGVPEVAWLSVPPEMKFSDLPEGERTAAVRTHLHLTTRYDDLIEAEIPRMLSRWPGLVVLVGAGVLGKIYCRRVKELGGIALDIGSLMDLWAGLRTREVPDFEGLRSISS